MQVTPIIICLVLISIVQAASVTKIPQPKLNLVYSQHLQSPEILSHKTPEERRKLSLFPKSYMKFVVSSESIYQIATHKPMVHERKKPLMKKLNLHDRNNKVEETETEQPIVNTEPMSKNNLTITPKVDTVSFSKKTNIEFGKAEKNNEKQNDNSEEENKLQNDSNKIETAKTDTGNKESPNLKDPIFPPTVEPIQISPENKKVEAFSDVTEIKKNSKEIEIPDWKEFIFVDPAHKATESDKISEEPEEYVTTEYYEEPEIVRQKRGSNVIEEENLASTVAGYKYTWKDTRLNNDVAFKNIHS